MKISIFTFIIIFSSLTSLAQVPQWSWAKGVGGIDSDLGNSITVDPNGFIYVAGFFEADTVIFGQNVLTNIGASKSIFIVKYDSNGNAIWATSIRGFTIGTSLSISSDNNGDVYVTGYFTNEILFDSITLTSPTITNADLFIAKYSSSGNCLWAHSFTGSSEDYPLSIANDIDDNVVITGYSQSDSISNGINTLIFPFGGTNLFVIKFDTNGNCVWSRTASCNSTVGGFGVAIDGFNNIYVTGAYVGDSITFGTTSAFPNQVTGEDDIFLVKFDQNGNALWVKSFGNVDGDKGVAVTTDASGNVIITGVFSGTGIYFDSFILNNTYDPNIFVVKLNSNGNVLWAKGHGLSSEVIANEIVTDVFDNVFIIGNYRYNSITFGTTTFPSSGDFDIFVVKYSSTGNILWALSPQGTIANQGRDIATDASGNAYITGFFGSSTMNFGSTSLTNAGQQDIFVAKLGNSVTTTEETFLKEDIAFYPNPFNQQTNLTLLKPLTNAKLTIHNTLGIVVGEIKNINTKSFSINRNDLPAGIYYISIIENGASFEIQKIVITD